MCGYRNKSIFHLNPQRDQQWSEKLVVLLGGGHACCDVRWRKKAAVDGRCEGVGGSERGTESQAMTGRKGKGY